MDDKLEVFDGTENFLDTGYPKFAYSKVPNHELETRRFNIDSEQFEYVKRRDMFGEGFALHMEMDNAILASLHRHPGTSSSFIGYETNTGDIYDIDFEDYLNVPFESPVERVSPRKRLENQFRLGQF